MASYQQLIYCKTCKKNTSLDDNNKCKFCGGTKPIAETRLGANSLKT